MPADLVEFLRARLAEDEQVAREAAGVPWVDDAGCIMVDPHAIADNKHALQRLGFVASAQHKEYRRHIARHDPARVLAEVEAKRRIIDGCEHTIQYEDYGIPGAEMTLTLLALPYADHPDYREEWRV